MAAPAEALKNISVIAPISVEAPSGVGLNGAQVNGNGTDHRGADIHLRLAPFTTTVGTENGTPGPRRRRRGTIAFDVHPNGYSVIDRARQTVLIPVENITVGEPPEELYASTETTPPPNKLLRAGVERIRRQIAGIIDRKVGGDPSIQGTQVIDSTSYHDMHQGGALDLDDGSTLHVSSVPDMDKKGYVKQRIVQMVHDTVYGYEGVEVYAPMSSDQNPALVYWIEPKDGPQKPIYLNGYDALAATEDFIDTASSLNGEVVERRNHRGKNIDKAPESSPADQAAKNRDNIVAAYESRKMLKTADGKGVVSRAQLVAVAQRREENLKVPEDKRTAKHTPHAVVMQRAIAAAANGQRLLFDPLPPVTSADLTAQREESLRVAREFAAKKVTRKLRTPIY
jgi:hypothetical protein